MTPKVIVVFRNDDISAKSDLKVELQAAEVFERYMVPQTIAVVPLCAVGDQRQRTLTEETSLSENKEIVTFLKRHVDRTESEIALHGYTHRTNRWSSPLRKEFFEFRRYSADEQERMIRHGTEILLSQLGVRPTTFVPPWNRYDENTVVACNKCEYRILSGGPFTPVQAPLVGLGVDCSLTELPERLMKAVASGNLAIIRVMYHSGHLTTARRMQELEDAVRLAAQTPGSQIMTLSEVVRCCPEEVFQANEAARNIVDPSDVPRDARSSCAPYFRLFKWVWPDNPLARSYCEALGLYEAGDYKQASAMTRDMDRKSRRLVWACRLSGGIMALCLGLLWHGMSAQIEGVAPHEIERIAGVTWTLVGAAAWWLATAPSTRREILKLLLVVLCGWIAGTIAAGSM